MIKRKEEEDAGVGNGADEWCFASVCTRQKKAAGMAASDTHETCETCKWVTGRICGFGGPNIASILPRGNGGDMRRVCGQQITKIADMRVG